MNYRVTATVDVQVDTETLSHVLRQIEAVGGTCIQIAPATAPEESSASRRRIDDTTRRLILEMLAAKIDAPEIARQMHVSESTVRRLRLGQILAGDAGA